jgi:glycerol-3-phosphate dehydrogenase
MGMKVYDQLAGRLGLAKSRLLSKAETIELIPNVETAGLDGGVVYHDGQFDDARLAIHLAMTAAAHGAVLANYCRCVGLLKAGDTVTGVRVRDQETREAFTIEAKVVVNANGVFVDELRSKHQPDAKPIVAVSQGIHLALPRRFLPGDAALMVPKTSDGRVLFAVPWHDCVVVGTTDTAMDSPSLEPRALSEEPAFVMEHAKRYLHEDPTDADVLSIFAGLRPLVKGEGSASTAALSRDHVIMVSQSGLITVTGGKWTTYRKMAEDVVAQIEMVGGFDERPCETVDLRLHGSDSEWGRAKDTIDAYGSDRAQVDVLAASRPDWGLSLHPRLAYRAAEVIWQVRHEMARTVDDVFGRRMWALFLDARAALEMAPRVVGLMAEQMGHDDAWVPIK